MSISTGYSAPSSQEVRPSAGGFNNTLNPERGTSYEAGLRGSALNSRLRFDVAVYRFQLRETIVRRSDAAGAEFFVNAGRTDQRGLEAQLSYDIVSPERQSGSALSSPPERRPGFSLLRFWNSLTLTNYRFRDYQQGTADLSNNRVTGIAPATYVTGLDAETNAGVYAHLTYQFLNPFPLNDANTVQSDPTQLLQATLGFRHALGQHWTLDLYASGDNLLNRTYSLGYDLNAVGNRYYNAAPNRNFIGGVRVSMKW